MGEYLIFEKEFLQFVKVKLIFSYLIQSWECLQTKLNELDVLSVCELYPFHHTPLSQNLKGLSTYEATDLFHQPLEQIEE